MIGQQNAVANALSLFRDPVTAEKRALLDRRWSALDDAVKLPGQGLGRKATGCGATAGIQPKCDFSCTGCYLGSEANRIPALPLAAVLAQLDALRAYLGPKSNVQITDGEVTLRPGRRAHRRPAPRAQDRRRADGHDPRRHAAPQARPAGAADRARLPHRDLHPHRHHPARPRRLSRAGLGGRVDAAARRVRGHDPRPRAAAPDAVCAPP